MNSLLSKNSSGMQQQPMGSRGFGSKDYKPHPSPSPMAQNRGPKPYGQAQGAPQYGQPYQMSDSVPQQYQPQQAKQYPPAARPAHLRQQHPRSYPEEHLRPMQHQGRPVPEYLPRSSPPGGRNFSPQPNQGQPKNSRPYQVPLQYPQNSQQMGTRNLPGQRFPRYPHQHRPPNDFQDGSERVGVPRNKFPRHPRPGRNFEQGPDLGNEDQGRYMERPKGNWDRKNQMERSTRVKFPLPESDDRAEVRKRKFMADRIADRDPDHSLRQGLPRGQQDKRIAAQAEEERESVGDEEEQEQEEELSGQSEDHSGSEEISERQIHQDEDEKESLSDNEHPANSKNVIKGGAEGDKMCSLEEFQARLNCFKGNNSNQLEPKLTVTSDFGIFELSKSLQPSLQLTIKRFARSSATESYREIKRTVKGIQTTMNYILENIVDSDRMNGRNLPFAVGINHKEKIDYWQINQFLYDRLRAISRDLTQLTEIEETRKEVILASEQIARYFLLVLYEAPCLGSNEKNILDSLSQVRVEIEKIMKSLLEKYRLARQSARRIVLQLKQHNPTITLQQLKADLESKQIYISPNEPELTAYAILLMEKTKMKVLREKIIDAPLFEADEVRKALELDRELNLENYEKYFKMLDDKETDIIFCCCLLYNLVQVRCKLLDNLKKGVKFSKDLSKEAIHQFLMVRMRFKDGEEQASQFVTFLKETALQIKNREKDRQEFKELAYPDNTAAHWRLGRDIMRFTYQFASDKFERKLYTVSNEHMPQSFRPDSRMSRKELISRSWTSSNYDDKLLLYFLGEEFQTSPKSAQRGVEMLNDKQTSEFRSAQSNLAKIKLNQKRAQLMADKRKKFTSQLESSFYNILVQAEKERLQIERQKREESDALAKAQETAMKQEANRLHTLRKCLAYLHRFAHQKHAIKALLSETHNFPIHPVQISNTTRLNSQFTPEGYQTTLEFSPKSEEKKEVSLPSILGKCFQVIGGERLKVNILLLFVEGENPRENGVLLSVFSQLFELQVQGRLVNLLEGVIQKKQRELSCSMEIDFEGRKLEIQFTFHNMIGKEREKEGGVFLHEYEGVIVFEHNEKLQVCEQVGRLLQPYRSIIPRRGESKIEKPILVFNIGNKVWENETISKRMPELQVFLANYPAHSFLGSMSSRSGYKDFRERLTGLFAMVGIPIEDWGRQVVRAGNEANSMIVVSSLLRDELMKIQKGLEVIHESSMGSRDASILETDLMQSYNLGTSERIPNAYQPYSEFHPSNSVAPTFGEYRTADYEKPHQKFLSEWAVYFQYLQKCMNQLRKVQQSIYSSPEKVRNFTQLIIDLTIPEKEAAQVQTIDDLAQAASQEFKLINQIINRIQDDPLEDNLLRTKYFIEDALLANLQNFRHYPSNLSSLKEKIAQIHSNKDRKTIRQCAFLIFQWYLTEIRNAQWEYKLLLTKTFSQSNYDDFARARIQNVSLVRTQSLYFPGLRLRGPRSLRDQSFLRDGDSEIQELKHKRSEQVYLGVDMLGLGDQRKMVKF